MIIRVWMLILLRLSVIGRSHLRSHGSKLNAPLKKAAARTIPELWDAIARLIQGFTPNDCSNYLAAAGYQPE